MLKKVFKRNVSNYIDINTILGQTIISILVIYAFLSALWWEKTEGD